MKKTKGFKTLDIIILGIILVISVGFRLYKINTPLADYHSWRQVDTAAVARNFVKNGFDLFHPRYDDISSIQSGQENPEGYRFVEFPVYNAVFALLYKYLPLTSLEIYGRLTTIFFSLIIIGAIYYLCLKEEDRLTAITASLIYSVFPFFVFFSRVILPETTATAFAFLAILFIYLYFENNRTMQKYLLFSLSILSFSLSLLVKPTTIFYFIPLLYLFARKERFNLFKRSSFYLYFILIVIPFGLWRLYIQNYPQGIPPSDWLITHVNTYEGLKNIFFRPAFFRWIFFERICVAIFGGFLSGFFLLGILNKPKKYFFYAILTAAFVYLFTFQGGNIQHEYYQTIALPALAIFAGLGIAVVLRNGKQFLTPVLSSLIIIFFVGLSYFFAFYKVKDYYNFPPELPQIANIINTLTKEDDKIVTDRLGDTTLLYLTGRKGAPAIYKDPDQLKDLGYNYLVTLNKDTIESIKQKGLYPVVFENDKFALFKL